MSNISRAKQKFSRLVTEWARAHRECSETYLAWQEACQRREAAAIKKNNAYDELEMARTQTNDNQ